MYWQVLLLQHVQCLAAVPLAELHVDQGKESLLAVWLKVYRPGSVVMGLQDISCVMIYAGLNYNRRQDLARSTSHWQDACSLYAIWASKAANIGHTAL